MKKILTRKFGEIQIDETKAITMPAGLPGFLDYKEFVLLEDPRTAPFCWLQSMEEPDLALVVMNPFLFKADYTMDLGSIVKNQGWKETKNSDLSIYVVVNISDIDKKITANLIGPIIINNKNRQAVQFVLSDSSYSHEYNILDTQS